MSRSVKFPVAVHVCMALAVYPQKLVSSEQLASSVDTNAVVIRRILKRLKEAGLVRSQGGSHGGSTLTRTPEEITLLDIYQAVEEAPKYDVHRGCKTCSIARAVTSALPRFFERIEAEKLKELNKTSLQSLLKDVNGFSAA